MGLKQSDIKAETETPKYGQRTGLIGKY